MAVVLELSCYLLKDRMIGKKFIKMPKEKLTSSRKAFEMMRGLTGSDYTHMDSHS